MKKADVFKIVMLKSKIFINMCETQCGTDGRGREFKKKSSKVISGKVTCIAKQDYQFKSCLECRKTRNVQTVLN